MTLRSLFKKVLRPFRPGIEAARRSVLGLPAVGQVDFGDLRRLAPISRKFGVDRGLPIDRFYVERFLDAHADDIRGHVLEIGEDTYTRRFGGARVMASDVLHVSADNPAATIVADLADAPQIPDDRFDAIILTQTLQLIFDPPAAIRTLHRILKPGGTLLVTVPGITPVATRQRLGADLALVIHRKFDPAPDWRSVRACALPLCDPRQRAGRGGISGRSRRRGPARGGTDDRRSRLPGHHHGAGAQVGDRSIGRGRCPVGDAEGRGAREWRSGACGRGVAGRAHMH